MSGISVYNTELEFVDGEAYRKAKNKLINSTCPDFILERINRFGSKGILIFDKSYSEDLIAEGLESGTLSIEPFSNEVMGKKIFNTSNGNYIAKTFAEA